MNCFGSCRTKVIGGLVVLAVVLVAGCTAGPNPTMDIANAGGDVAGFWMGLWHGFIAPVTFVISLFSDAVTPYEVHNSGGWYNFGFLLSAGVLLGGGGRASRRRK